MNGKSEEEHEALMEMSLKGVTVLFRFPIMAQSIHIELDSFRFWMRRRSSKLKG